MPDANIGITTGKTSNLIVLDVDGPMGEATLAEIERKYGSLPPTWQVKTGKGRHLYFRFPKDVAKVKSVARKKLGLDVRADGGYVLAPVSIHVSGRRYTLDKKCAIAKCPAWIAEYANGSLTILRTFKGKQPAQAFASLNLGTEIANPELFKDGPAAALRAAIPTQEDNLARGIRTNTTPTPYSEAEETRLRSALARIPANERDTWRDIGFALHSLDWGDKGFEIWTDWSRTWPEKFEEADQQKTWESFDRPYDGVRVTAGTIFYKASQLGWVEEPRQIDFRTDLGNARRLVNRHGKNIRYIPEWRKWMAWEDGRWKIDSDGAIMRLAKETVEAIYLEALGLPSTEERDALLSHAIRSQAEARLKAMVSLAESEGSVVAAARLLDADPWLLGVQNGVIELKTRQFRPARWEDLITKRAGVVFDPDAQCPQWLKFLDTVTGGDASLQAYMQRVVGYTLTGIVSEEVLFVLYGIGSNGKSTYRETVHALLGDYALAADAGLLTERKKPGGATEEIARLKGRRFVAVNETAENDHLSEARIKFITSQDTITARNLYGHLFDFFPTHKTALTTNHKPIVRGTDEGIWRRLHLIPFIVTISKSAVEKDFRERRLMPELSGILNWALAGLADYLKQGLNPPRTVLASTQDYRNDMDVVGQWIAERCEVNPKASVPTSAAYSDYSQWAADEVGWELRKLTFRRHLSDRGFAAVKGTHGQRMIVGLRLKSTSTQASLPDQTTEDVGRPHEADAAMDEHIKRIKVQASALGGGNKALTQGLEKGLAHTEAAFALLKGMANTPKVPPGVEPSGQNSQIAGHSNDGGHCNERREAVVAVCE